MSGKYTFQFTSDDGRRNFPGKMIFGRAESETIAHVVLKLVAYLYFFRERIQVETRLPDANIPFIPDLAQLDYELRPKLWVECGECSIAKLHKLAVKAPEAEIWLVKRSVAAAEDAIRSMVHEDLRRNRYQIIGLNSSLFDEMCGLVEARNSVYWLKAESDPPEMHFELNGLWFELPFHIFRF